MQPNREVKDITLAKLSARRGYSTDQCAHAEFNIRPMPAPRFSPMRYQIARLSSSVAVALARQYSGPAGWEYQRR
jgi:hypothetical protein